MIRNIKSQFLLVVILIAAIFLFIRFFSLLKAPTDDECEEEKKMSFKGIITGIELDSFNKAQKFIIINNEQKIIPTYTYGLWNEIEVGDSIVKEAGSLNYKTFNIDSINPKKVLTWDRACD
jgi:hypothetical protein